MNFALNTETERRVLQALRGPNREVLVLLVMQPLKSTGAALGAPIPVTRNVK